MAKQKKSTATKTKKKVAKKTTTAVAKAENPKPTIDVENDLLTLNNGKKLSLIPASQMPLSKPQILTLLQRTPQQHILTRPGKGGGTFEYVSGVYVKKVLNYVFGFNWDFDIVEHGKEDDQVWVKGKLTVRDGKGGEVRKMQFGRADIKYKKGTKTMLDFGNDLKAATTDALKKCASELGIASDVYGKAEFKDLNADVQFTNDTPAQQPAPQKQQIQNKPQQNVQLASKPTQTQTNGANYIAKLKETVIKLNGGKSMNEAQIIAFVNKKVGTTAKSISSQNHAKVLLNQLLLKK